MVLLNVTTVWVCSYLILFRHCGGVWMLLFPLHHHSIIIRIRVFIHIYAQYRTTYKTISSTDGYTCNIYALSSFISVYVLCTEVLFRWCWWCCIGVICVCSSLIQDHAVHIWKMLIDWFFEVQVHENILRAHTHSNTHIYAFIWRLDNGTIVHVH